MEWAGHALRVSDAKKFGRLFWGMGKLVEGIRGHKIGTRDKRLYNTRHLVNYFILGV